MNIDLFLVYSFLVVFVISFLSLLLAFFLVVIVIVLLLIA